jgi:glycerate kinase
VRVVAAPNPFKGSLGAPAAAAAIRRGVRSVFPAAEVVEVPVADGGEGTVEALVAAHSGETVRVDVQGPLGDRVEADFGLIEGGATAVIELAASSGLPLVPVERRDPRVTSTFGFGQVLEEARRRGAGRVIAGIGGSATNDGGAGMAQALGYRLLDANGSELAAGGAPLARLDRIDGSGVDPAWRAIKVSVATDVINPLCGPEGASAVYGPQKGADAGAVAELDAALANFARVVERDLGRPVAGLPGAGAAGGAGAGLVAFLGAELVRGAPLVVDAAGLDAALDGAAFAFSGEGRVDNQTAYGKGPVEVARRAQAAGVPVVLIVGALAKGWEAVLSAGVTAVVPLPEGPASLEYLERETGSLIERAAARACRLISVGFPR